MKFSKNKNKILIFCLAFVLIFSPLLSTPTAEAINKDNVRNYYCGSVISGSDCKCAFHGDGCDSDQQNMMNQRVMDGFYAWLAA
ncbi:hypothetical protein KKG48_02150, partial [Patescibacteria group bacterium]|nr:hypothetical protein [Patescibacteria group bacterium]